MKVSEIIDELRFMVENGDKIPLTKKVLIDSDYVLNLIAELEEELPVAIGEAEELLSKRQEILDDAKNRADEEIKKIIAEVDVVKEAQEVANEIRVGVNEYADEVLAEIESGLEKKLNEIRKNRTELQPKEHLEEIS
ncbi:MULTISPECIES: type I restriction endonuclease subunit R, EcoR124 family [unclassified Candidatus Frackibacter]|uniref:type I restriction endonuclease subunit R, EcoR124 family n=1 Tax=unclassified Candidatus Frackibacter TaxID=2648818 RepID=UPI00079A4384|nr:MULTISPECIES: hypothetical protein [unclassified Candidatus Frackibacter]KXS39611.1 MAG: hypothetical protein AWU54_2163 [Candidatus Frackibacter sp. T328-2]SDC56719.1 Type I restriction and modification enzyme -subunit R C terminal [Candidatus Frackibacter sp. WG11]SEM70986.1 Type I restriction and modification enzyme -subunit R C terminal [Candidatus Frackibacter sp. WG12]SFL83367.1 Type I restriction and modification enzyme -subunit R C terminal [Candidatus Frackibacter sp. WG13]